jgi:hypothetical protein
LCFSPTAAYSPVFLGEEQLQRRSSGTPTWVKKFIAEEFGEVPRSYY